MLSPTYTDEKRDWKTLRLRRTARACSDYASWIQFTTWLNCSWHQEVSYELPERVSVQPQFAVRQGQGVYHRAIIGGWPLFEGDRAMDRSRSYRRVWV